MQRTDDEVAAFFGVSTRTIERRRHVKQFGEVMDRAKAAAAIFLSKNLLGYKDYVANEMSGPMARRS